MTTWGAWEYGGGNGMRVGIDGTVEAISHGETEATFTYKVYTDNQYQYSGDGQVLTYGGSAGSGSTSYTNDESTSATLRATRTYDYTYPSTSYGTSPGTRSFSATVSGAYNGVTPTHSVTIAIPARPYAAPAPPTSAVAARVNDNQATVTWVRHATTGEPYTSQTLQMRTWDAGVWGAYATVASPSGSASSATVNGLLPDRGYQFQVRATNSAGSSAYAVSGAIYMTPDPPSSVVAARVGGGIQVTWVRDDMLAPGTTFTIERSVAGGAFAALVSGLTASPYTDPAPGVGTNQYQVSTVGPGPLTSAPALSNVVTTTVAPLAPTLLTPNGLNVDLALTPVVLSWQFNHGGDGATQSHYTVEVSNNGGTTWVAYTSGDVASSASTHTIPAGTLPNGVNYLWRVRTEGIVSAGYGPNSAAAAFTGSAVPTVVITAPPDPLTTMPLVVSWTYAQAAGSPQAAWEASLYASNGTTLLEARSGAGTAASTTFAYALVNGTTYVVKVRVQSGAGLWSRGPVAEFGSSNTAGAALPSLAAYGAQPFPAVGAAVITELSVFGAGTGLPIGTVVGIATGVNAGDTNVPYIGKAVLAAPIVGWGTVILDHEVPIVNGVFYTVVVQDTHVGVYVPPDIRAGIVGTPMSPMRIGTDWNTGDGGHRMAFRLRGPTVTSKTFTLTLAPPAAAHIVGEYQPCTGTTVLSVTADPAGTPPGSVAVDHVKIERSTDGGATWVVLVSNLVPPTDFVDVLPNTSGDNLYRVTSYSASGSATVSAPITVTGTNGATTDPDGLWVFLSWGDDFTNVLRFRGDPSIAETAGRVREARHFLGRPKPVLLIGENTDFVVAVSGSLHYDTLCGEIDPDDCTLDSPSDDWIAAGLHAEVVSYRDYTGTRIFAMLSDVSVTEQTWPGHASLSFNVTEIDYVEIPGVIPA